MQQPDTYKIARQLVTSKGWTIYLDKEDGALFEQVASSQSHWTLFLDNPIKHLSNRRRHFDLGLLKAENGSDLHPALVFSLKVREMIYEQFLAYLYPLEYTSAIAAEPKDENTNEIYDTTQSMDLDVKETENVEVSLNVLIPVDDLYHTLEFDDQVFEALPKLQVYRLT